MRQINGIIIHCAATRPAWMDGKTTSAKVREIKRWHTDPKPKGRGWSDIGYHFLIDRDGTCAKGRPVTRTGAHVKGHNTGTIGICLIGGHGSSKTDNFSDHFTYAQEKALRRKLDDMRSIYGDVWIKGHNDFAAKGCPGFDVAGWLKPAEAPTPPKQPATGLWAWLRRALGF